MKPWIGGKEMYHLQLPKGLTVLEQAYCVLPRRKVSMKGFAIPPAKESAANTNRR
jgi:hypothetical protein